VIDFKRLKNPLLFVKVTREVVVRAHEIHRRSLDGNDNNYRIYKDCPVALAATRALRARFRRHPNIRAHVGWTFATIWDGSHRVDVELPKEAQAIVRDFPGACRPAHFSIDLSRDQ
jgi:hypothetical protein